MCDITPDLTRSCMMRLSLFILVGRKIPSKCFVTRVVLIAFAYFRYTTQLWETLYRPKKKVSGITNYITGKLERMYKYNVSICMLTGLFVVGKVSQGMGTIYKLTSRTAN